MMDRFLSPCEDGWLPTSQPRWSYIPGYYNVPRFQTSSRVRVQYILTTANEEQTSFRGPRLNKSISPPVIGCTNRKIKATGWLEVISSYGYIG